ncbi:rhamnulokinase [Aureibacillus halotolerans]|uniref:Rhamnulokinase n=1 Tax=Aureibacillus halotolerans TaxID=1508390 RepID=A0A4R6U0X2_9BACI|nr:rhamnulokinase family protein [Aureibacillus halotolerans]TDQ38273.1 rhamnulokinase [Aureibacillus halotolerans]
MTVLAFDLGASSGRLLVGALTDGCLVVKEVHRFDNTPVRVHDALHWDVLKLWHEMKVGLKKAVDGGWKPESIGIDTWAVDYGLLDRQGQLLGHPFHYRDQRTKAVMDNAFQTVSREDIFMETGIQFLEFNTLYQLISQQQSDPERLEQAKTLLMMPDLLRYFLTGETFAERTNASTTQCWSPKTETWSKSLFDAFDLPIRLMPPLLAPGDKAGTLTAAVTEETGMDPIPVIAVGEHDTASAVAAVPAKDTPFAYLSCGTWSLLGTEVETPVITEQSATWNFTNEAGVYGSYRLLKNIMGLWLLQESMRVWEREGKPFSFEKMNNEVAVVAPFRSLIDPDDPRFLKPANMVQAIQQYCADTNQPVPATQGEIVRTILESLALAYRRTLERTEQLVGNTFQGLHMVGGGIQNKVLCQMTANAIGRPVWAGPIEGTGIGNMLVQLIALGRIEDLQEARRIVARSETVTTYEPSKEADAWTIAYKRFLQLVD